MSPGTPGLTESANLISAISTKGRRPPVVGDGRHLTIAEVVALLRAAGYSDAASTVRRMVTAGKLQAYLTPGGHRRVLASSVDELIEQRRPKPRADPPGPTAEPD